VVLDADATRHIHVVLNGLQGEPVMGTTYPSPMPAFGATLKDADIADIVNHERTSWGNRGKQVTADQVAKVRAQK
jgi:nitrite reductase (NO-forming)